MLRPAYKTSGNMNEKSWSNVGSIYIYQTTNSLVVFPILCTSFVAYFIFLIIFIRYSLTKLYNFFVGGNANLGGNISSSIGNLGENLQELHLGQAALTGTIPAEIGALSGELQ